MAENPLLYWKRVLLRGATATSTEARAIEQRVQDAPVDLVARVEALACTKGEVRAGHLLWLIKNAPWLPLDSFWMCRQDNPVYETGKQAWLVTLKERSEDASVGANAAWYFMMSEPRLAEEILRREPISTTSIEWMQALEGFYSTRIISLRVNVNEVELSQVAARARLNLEALFDAMPTDRQRHSLLWPLRRYAAMAQDQLASSLYMAASKESDRAPHEHVSRTVRGLVAAAKGDLSGAEKWLLDAASVLEVGIVPAVRLAEEMLRRDRKEPVLLYVEACERIVGAESPPLVVLRGRLAGRKPEP